MEDNKLNKCELILRWLEKRAKILKKGIAKDAADFKCNERRTRGGDGR